MRAGELEKSRCERLGELDPHASRATAIIAPERTAGYGGLEDLLARR